MSHPVRIPADVDMHDRVLGPLTARQLAVLAVTGAVLYLIWAATRAFVPIPVFAAFAVPVGAAAVMLALGKRDGMPLDTLLLAAIRQRLAPRHRVAAPEGVRPAPAWLTPTEDRTTGGKGRVERPEQVSPSALRLPAEAVTETGVVDLGGDGLAVVAVASTVNFALRTPNEQEALVASFGRYGPYFERQQNGEKLTASIPDDIAPADLIQFKRSVFTGFVTDVGGKTSHTAIVARSLNVPAVVATHNARQLIRDGENGFMLSLDVEQDARRLAAVMSNEALSRQISEAARQEVLARLLRLNHERYAEEVKQGLHETKKVKATSKPMPN